MKLYGSLLTAMALCLAISACHKDNGNYSYKDLNEITVSAVSDTVYVKQFDTLKLTPTVKQAQPDESQLQYSWYYFPTVSSLQVPTQVISDQKVLNAQIGVVPGNFWLYLKVTDKRTQVSEYHKFLMVVTTSIAEGWLAMYDVSADSSDAALMLTTGGTLYNLFKNANGRHFAGQSRSLVNFTAGWNKQYIFGLTDKEGDYISATDFSVLKSFDSAFYGTPAVEDYKAIYPNPGSDFLQDYLINGDKVYFRTWQGPFSVPKYGASLEGDYKAAPFILGSPYYNFGPYPTVVYDESHHKFIYVPLNQTAFQNFDDDATAAFNLNQMGDKTMLFGYNSSTGQATTLFRNNGDDSFFVYKLDFTASYPAVSKQGVVKAANPDLPGATLFDISPNLPILYYVKDNKIYKYDIAANASTLLYSWPAGVPVTAMKILNPPRPDRYNPANLGRRLAAATFENGEGVVYEFTITPTGVFDGGTFIKRTDGFGKVSSLFYKLQL